MGECATTKPGLLPAPLRSRGGARTRARSAAGGGQSRRRQGVRLRGRRLSRTAREDARFGSGALEALVWDRAAGVGRQEWVGLPDDLIDVMS